MKLKIEMKMDNAAFVCHDSNGNTVLHAEVTE